MSDTPTRRGTWNRGFVGLMIIQFSGAMNDNLLRGSISLGVAAGGIWAATAIGAYGGTAIVGLCLTIPFLLFSGWGGQIADRYSKRTMTIWLKVVEMVIALCCAIGFILGSPLICLACLFSPVLHRAGPCWQEIVHWLGHTAYIAGARSR